MSIRVGLRHMGRILGAVLCPDPEYIECNILSAYNLCTTEFEELVAQTTSAYNLCIPEEKFLIVSPASTYNLTVT